MDSGRATIIGLSILCLGLLIAVVCIWIRGERMQRDLVEHHHHILHQHKQQQQQHSRVHECKLLDAEAKALKDLRVKLMNKPGEMVPIFNPRFNARQIVIELILLQQHLEFPGMLCKECIARKHMLAIEGYALEAIGLIKAEVSKDPEIVQLVKDMTEVARMIRDLQKMFMDNPQGNALEIARAVRGLRKELSVKYGILPVPS